MQGNIQMRSVAVMSRAALLNQPLLNQAPVEINVLTDFILKFLFSLLKGLLQ